MRVEGLGVEGLGLRVWGSAFGFEDVGRTAFHAFDVLPRLDRRVPIDLHLTRVTSLGLGF